MNHETLLENIKQAKSFSVDMCKNTITLEFEIPGVQFNCNWKKQKLVEVLGERTLNASCNNISMKDSNKTSVPLPIYESLLLKTNQHEKMSVGYYRVPCDGEI